MKESGHHFVIYHLQLLLSSVINWDITTLVRDINCIKLIIYFSLDASIFDDERFGRTNALNTFKYKQCNSDQQYFSECTEVRKESVYFISYSRCTTEYGLRCYSKLLLLVI